MADQLRRRVADRLTDTQQRITKLVALGGDLHQVLARLQHPAHNGPCVEGEYVCLSNETTVPPRTPLLLPNVEGDVDAELACTLHPDRMPDRMTDWQALLGRATGREPISGGVAVRFPLDLELSRELVRLASAEHDCCRFFDFALHITADGLNLRVTGFSEAQPVIAAVFGVPGEPFTRGSARTGSVSLETLL